MTDFFRRCPDGHRCENGSLCQEDPKQEGTYYCDCDSAIGSSKFAGLYCEYPAEEECKFEGEIDSSWFCVNQGTCVITESNKQVTMTCDCNDNFEGPVRCIKIFH